jgi:hypothetical protein
MNHPTNRKPIAYASVKAALMSPNFVADQPNSSRRFGPSTPNTARST